MATTAPILWLDGALVATRDATFPVVAQAPQRGSLVFDVGSFHHARLGAAGASGPALFRAPEHAARLLRSARLTGLSVAYGEDALVKAALDVVVASGLPDGLVRWSVFFSAPEPDLVPRDATTRVAVSAHALDDAARITPMRVAIFEDARKAPPEVLSPEVKAAGAYLGPTIARRRAVAAGAEEVILLDRDGFVAEAPTANVVAVVNGSLWTPPLHYVLPGITRDTVLALAADEGLPIREEPLPLDQLTSADEAFLTSTSLPIVAIGTINARAMRSAPGPITLRLANRLAAIQRGEDVRSAAWMRLAKS